MNTDRHGSGNPHVCASVSFPAEIVLFHEDLTHPQLQIKGRRTPVRGAPLDALPLPLGRANSILPTQRRTTK